MFTQIMVPVDLVHKDKLQKALDVAGQIAKSSGAKVHVVSVGGVLPGKLGHTPSEFGATLNAFAEELKTKYGIEVDAHPITSPDPATDATRHLMRAIDDVGADLVIMASHQPGIMEHIFSSHGGYVAQHAKCSVFVVR
ncbi:universal stress protein UspA [Pelagivirga sediminicola]|uniref:Universal stress protein UspA n=1 Tax=Pelagivirga sediminicola TaxID=2170575 RepID=A0A2T7G6T5_9RHOB|nr:universal stress protein [Pelagivirga sediminicola]PVA10145.1 universal stress protein UspA [Pelagivirga sediminicola]